ncbi:F-type conjugal transfer pilus assembly protein TraB [Enterobacter asburiae]
MKNINIQTKRKQVAILVAVILGLGTLGGLGLYGMTRSPESADTSPPGEPAPDMTGVVNTTFDDKVQSHAVEEVQQVGRDVNEKFKTMEGEIRTLSDSNAELQRQVESLRVANDNLKLAGGTEKPAGTAPVPPVSSTTPGQGYTGTAPLPQGNAGQPPVRYDGMGIPPDGQVTLMPPDSGLHRQTFAPPAAPERFHFPYIPSGSFAQSVVLEGADANASVTGAQNTSPMQLRLTGKIQMPNDKEFDLTGCFVTLEAYGDVSSERAEVRTHKLSCNIGNEVIDQPIEGHVSFMGKNGIKGEVVMRNGKVLGFAWGAGFLEGIGKGVESAGTTTVGMGATASPGAGDILKSGIGGGTSSAAKTLSEYYIKRAEQYHPVIPIGAGNDVTLVFNDGFQIQTVAEALKAKTGAAAAGDASSGAGRAGSAISSAGNAVKNTLNDLRRYKLGDIVSPGAGDLLVPEGQQP